MFNSKTKGIISGISLSNLKSIEIPIFSGKYWAARALKLKNKEIKLFNAFYKCQKT